MRVAIIGAGISGLLCARLLHDEHDVTLFEAADHIGGHTHTVPVERGGRRYHVDTGFIVYNERTYPNFTRLLSLLGVQTQPTTMSFSVHCERTGFEYGTSGMGALLARPSNALRPASWRIARDLLRFQRGAAAVLECADEDLSLRKLLSRSGYSSDFVDHYVVPMGAAIWSTAPARFLDFPAATFVRFFHNHGLLSLTNQPQWRVVRGGSARYVEKLVAPIRNRVRRIAVQRIRRTPAAVEVHAGGGVPETFDRVVIAAHSDQALRMLADATRTEREILGAMTYQRNEAVLHTDTRMMPVTRRAWAAWNYRIPRQPGPVAVTYDMTRLQGLDSEETFCVTLNGTSLVQPQSVLRTMTWHHPLFDRAAIRAQKRRAEISGVGRTFYAGAYWGYGFHEDGVVSALAVTQRFGIGLERLLPRIERPDTTAAWSGSIDGARVAG